MSEMQKKQYQVEVDSEFDSVIFSGSDTKLERQTFATIAVSIAVWKLLQSP